ncbi:MFS general substrate transporter [Leucosporidium creatinivorum]|uniref:MFS general substrate transporter n=1 Tax=Leucosporidium creatinivorum TaxID=106004 RepID=A0A1Y2EQ15_9BASI|nr:MFS general substrate transporter [Leucosporidium creatinivorum]
MQATEIHTHQDKAELAGDGPVPVAFTPNDPENPIAWSEAKRWRVLFVALTVSYTSAFNAAANGAVSSGFRKEHPDVSATVFQCSSLVYLAMLGIGPLILAPVSETFGRRPMLASLTLLITLLFLPQALAPNVISIIISRLVQGTFACIEGPIAAGVVADLTTKSNRGIMMSTFVLAIFTANSTGPLCANWVAQEIGWRWVYWIQMMSNGVCWLLCLFFFPETRGEVILGKRAKALEASTGRSHYVNGLDVHESWATAFRISCTRPLNFLFCESIVTALSLWVGFAWGVVFLFTSTTSHIFQKQYGFTQGQGGTVLISSFIGAFISWCLNATVQERLYQRALVQGAGKAQPEVRLYSSAVGGIVFAVGLFCFGWTARPWIHWIVPSIFIVVVNVGLFSVYLATYSYLGDTYESFSSSAQAAQSLLRNILGGCFPLFSTVMYDKLTFPIASTVLGGIASFFAIIPWIIIFYGPALRARSSVAKAMELAEGTTLRDEPEPEMVHVV